MPFGWWDSSLPMSDLPSALMAALGAIMIMMEISQAITGKQHSTHCRHTNGLICNWERGKWLWACIGFVWWSMEKCILDLSNEESLVLHVQPRVVITQTLRMRRCCARQSLSSMFSLEESFSLRFVQNNLCYPEDMEGKLFLEVIVAFELTLISRE